MSPSFATRALSSTTPFNAPLQEAVTSFAWGQVWSRPGLGRRDRSLLNLAILIALSKPTELAGHTRGALNNGITKEELAEVALHAAVYCGFPAALDAARTMERVVNEVEAEQLAERERQKEQEHEHEKEHGHEGKKEDKEP
ncbi:related to uncharacterized homolog of gamma-carboxymuconolactone decarboxylase subunit [Pseudozyma flocculosa]|nr:related to uncharacterized homolog of gamma-carboxymuconolactone decarboxylase subunit [Pseudozyma flocculosa]